MNDMAAQMSEENARDNEIFEAIANALQALNNLTMIQTMADCAADALAARGINTDRIRLREIDPYTQEMIEMLTSEED